MSEHFDVVVVGAGIAGLSAARVLAGSGRRTLVLDRARGIGGRCAVRRIEGRAVDFGLPFLHGRDPAFLAEIDAVPATRIEGWPAIREGGGLPCQPEAFQGRDRVLVFREGLNALHHHLASGLEVRCGMDVVEISTAGEAVSLHTRQGATFVANAALITAPAPHARALLASLALREPAVAGTDAILEQVRYVPCLTLIAEYAQGTQPPRWEVSLPRISTAVHAILNDSSKRASLAPLVLVFHAGIAYSRTHLAAPAQSWVPGLLHEAARMHGEWIAQPVRQTTHVWEFARVQRPTELAAPSLLTLSNGARLGLCGDAFSPAGGAEGAYTSGRRAARELLGQPATAAPA